MYEILTKGVGEEKMERKRVVTLCTERCMAYKIPSVCVAFTRRFESIFRVECLYMSEYYSNFYKRSKFIGTTFF